MVDAVIPPLLLDPDEAVSLQKLQGLVHIRPGVAQGLGDILLGWETPLMAIG
jgi:hypothetical protein